MFKGCNGRSPLELSGPRASKSLIEDACELEVNNGICWKSDVYD